jgi:hypothetical protein
MFSLPDKKQWLDILKALVYVSLSAGLDYLISLSAGTTFGTLTVPINIALVFIKKLLTPVGL